VPGCADGTCTPADPNAAFNSPDTLAQLANDLGGAILVGHSLSASFPTRAALRPGSTGVKGIIQLETGCAGILRGHGEDLRLQFDRDGVHQWLRSDPKVFQVALYEQIFRGECIEITKSTAVEGAVEPDATSILRVNGDTDPPG